MNMAHHHHAPNHPHDEGKESGEFKLDSSDTATPNVSHSSREVKKETENMPPHEKSIFDYQIAGFPWSFVAVMSVIAIAVLGMILKLMGVF
jgi:hypothetical protein